jgi:hypothetical protein
VNTEQQHVAWIYVFKIMNLAESFAFSKLNSFHRKGAMVIKERGYKHAHKEKGENAKHQGFLYNHGYCLITDNARTTAKSC